MEDSSSRKPGMLQAHWFRMLITCICVVAVVAGCAELYRRAERYGTRVVEAHPVDALVEITNPPAWLDRQIVSALLDESYQFLQKDEATYQRARNVLDRDILQEIAGIYTGVDTVDGKTVRRQATGFNAWIKQIPEVRRNVAKDKSVQTIQILAEWRMPAAWIRVGEMMYLVDAVGTRLPGDYPVKLRQPSRLMVLTGVELPLVEGKAAVPAPGELWAAGKDGQVGGDLLAGMKMIGALGNQKYVQQIDAIDLSNFGGRKDARAAWITLPTVWQSDQGVAHVVQWGRPVGAEEYYDIKAAEKLKVLGELYGRFGRIDAGREYVDIHMEGVRMPKLATQADAPAAFVRG